MYEVKLVAITQPLIENNGVRLTPDEFLAYTARVSNPSNQNNTKTASKLLQYCINNGHWSVFEQVSISIEAKLTRDIGRQVLRHSSQHFQEFSQRYAEALEFFTEREARLQDKKNRQNSVETEDNELQLQWNILQEEVKNVSEKAYRWALEQGIAKECARVVLPEGLTVSTMYQTATLRDFIHWIRVRSKINGAQKEHVELAEKTRDLLVKEFPSIAEYLNSL